MDETELQALKGVLAALLAAVRNFSLYPSEHSICQRCTRHLKNSLSEFFKYEKKLKIEINKDGLSYREMKLYEPSEKNDSLLSPLFRDGILWIEIFPDIELSELEIFLKLFGEHRSLIDEAGSDLVTALWKANLTNIRYEAINSFWENPPVFDFGDFSLGNEPWARIENDQNKEALPNGPSEQSFPNIKKSEGLTHFFELTTTENQLLSKLISKNNQEDTEDIIDILVIVLDDQNAERDFSYLLELLEQELKLALENTHFNLVHTMLEKMKPMASGSSEPLSWRKKLIDDFFLKLSSDETLKSLETGLLKLKTADSNQISSAKNFMLMLEPKAVETLAQFLLKGPSRTVQILLMNAMKTLALRNLAPLERLLGHPNVLLVKYLIAILGQIKGRHPRDLLLRLMDHSSEDVRQKALLCLIKRGELPMDKIEAFLNDPDPQVRSQVFDYMRRGKNPMYERILRSYIEKKKFGRHDRAFLITCYQALGKCASNESLPFLEKQLFKGIGFPLFGLWPSRHRLGSAVALAEAGSQDAKQILSRASRCFYPSIRRAYKKALEVTAISK